MIFIKVSAPLKSFYVLKEPLEIAGCTISTEKGNMVISTTAEAEDEKTARNYALEKIRKAILSWSLSINEFLDFDEFLTKMTVISGGETTKSVSFTIDALLVSEHLKPDKEEELRSTVQLFENADDYGIKCAEYYERGIAMRSWRSEAVLNFYKACELICDKTLAETSEEDITQRFNKPKKETTMKEKMLIMCEKLGITGDLKEKALSLPKIRSTQDVGHATLHEPPLAEEVLKDFMEVAKAVVLRFLRSTTNTD